MQVFKPCMLLYQAFTKLMETGNELKEVEGGAADIPPTNYGSQPAPPPRPQRPQRPHWRPGMGPGGFGK